MSQKKYVIGGNWKCNGTRESITELVKILNEGGEFPERAEVVVAPVALHIGAVQATIRPEINVACQNIGLNKGSGAFTGDVAADMVADFGLKWAITGHSERRALAGETDAQVAIKTRVAVEAGLNAIACIGEQLSDREAGETLKVVTAQLEAINAELTPEQWNQVVIAYEPVWAIGTGVTATPEQAQEAHEAIRKWVADTVSPEVAASIRIIYGGSAKGSNCQGLIALPDVDGFLVGGASLKADFLNIIKCVPA
jgi:triosephosphate isomerase